jgi:hypothetical protein
MRTKQEIFDTVVRAMIAQGRPARSATACLYRMREGERILKCAVGVLIPDGFPFLELDNRGIEEGVTSSENPVYHTDLAWAELLRQVPELKEYRVMLGKLQQAHDRSDDGAHGWLTEFLRKAEGVALDQELDPAVVREAVGW